MHRFSRAFVRLALCSILGLPTPALGVSFIGCDKAQGEVAKGPHRDWALCQGTLPIADARGRGAAYAQQVALSGSKKYVILLVHGDRLDIVMRAETTLRALMTTGYPALGMVLADGESPTVMEVFSAGRTYDRLRNVDAHNGELGIRAVVTEAYERDIGPRRTVR